MKDIIKKNIIIFLAALLVVQICLIFALSFFSKQSKKARSYKKVLIKNLKEENIESITISDIQDSFSIERQDDFWFVKIKDKYIPADTQKLSSFIETLKSLNQGIIKDKGSTSENYSFYGFESDTQQKIVIKFKKGKEHTIIIGKTGSKRGTSYIRYNQEKKIREVESNIAIETNNQPELWAKRKIFEDIQLNDIEKLEVDSFLEWFKGNYTIVYKEEEGEQKDNFILIPPPADKKIAEYSLSNIIINTINIIVDNYKLEGSVPENNIETATLKLTLKNGKSYKIDIYKAEPGDLGDYIIDVDFTNYLYLVDENDVKRFLKPVDELLEK